MIGETGQKIGVTDSKGNDLFIGDALRLVDRKNNIAAKYKIFFNSHTLSVELVNESNKVVSGGSSTSVWYSRAYHSLADILNGKIPHLDIIRLGDYKYAEKHLKKAKYISNLVLKPY